MRVEAGHHRATASDGTELHVDQPLTTEQADLILQAVRASGQDLDDVYAVDITEGRTIVEWYWTPRTVINGDVQKHSTIIAARQI